MSTSIHHLIIMPGATGTIICEDGLSHLEKFHVQFFFNFGNVRFEDCGAENEFVDLEKAESDMWFRYTHSKHGGRRAPNHDFRQAFYENRKDVNKFQHTDIYKSWVKNRNPKEVMTEALGKHWCGRAVKYDGYHKYLSFTQNHFMQHYCPDVRYHA